MTPREHVLTGYDCWCAPRFERPCDECDTGCWKCDRGVIRMTRDEAAVCEFRVVIIHNVRGPA